MTIGIFLILAVVHLTRYLLDMYLMQRFIMRWRIWLSRWLIDDWLGDYAYFRRQFLRRPNDNPDQRIQQDIDIFTTGVGGQTNNPAYGSSSTLLFGAVDALLSVVSFGAILFHISGPLTLGGVTIPRALFWIVIVYVLAATVIAFVIGRPLIRLSYLNELRNAGFRYALVRVRDAGAAIGLYRGENVERRLLGGRLSEVMANYGNWLNRMVRFTGWNLTVSQAINPLPYVVQAPRLFARQISIGDVIQSAYAFGVIHESLSFFRLAYDEFASYRAAVIRLDGLAEENSRARGFSQVTTASSADGTLAVDGIEVRTPDGAHLVRSLDVSLEAGRHAVGQRTVRNRQNGSAAESCRALAVRVRECSPAVRQTGDDVRASAAVPPSRRSARGRVVPQRGGRGRRSGDSTGLIKVALPHLAIRLNDAGDWGKVLSVGEQQRIAFARILLTKPNAVFLDESTSALDEGLELTLYELIRAELPDIILVSVSHRSTVEQFHGRQLELVGGGEWRLEPLTTGS